MKKRDLVELVAEATGIGRADSAKAVEAMIKGMAEALSRGEDINLPGLGTFSAPKRRIKTGRNPRTGERIDIAPPIPPRFKPDKKRLARPAAGPHGGGTGDQD